MFKRHGLSSRQLTGGVEHANKLLVQTLPSCLRNLSSTPARAEEDKSPKEPPKGPPAPRHNAQLNFRRVFFASPTSNNSRPDTGSRSGPVDARSLGHGGASQSGDRPRVLRAPAALENLRNRRRLGDAPGGSAPAGSSRYPQRRGPSAPFIAGGPNRNAQASRRRRGPRRDNRGASDEGADEHDDDASAEAYYLEKQEAERPKPVRYDPEGTDTQKLKPTWPSLPIGATANAESISEKLSWMGDRFANGYDPPAELAKRVYDGKRVLFASEEEKTRVMELVHEMAAEKAEVLTERKGAVVEPEDMAFESTNNPERKHLLDSLVIGNYPKLEPPADASPVIADVLRTLRNNESYQTAETKAFMDKLVGSLPSAKPKVAPKSA
ncbi:hypothetical protein AJ80_04482 [Polytolypa hystricis UAMH7299]|uniref:Uncharacterized protein n=1 Tax=Polytolypa hystricis (strain UAMH7299) TaxID=1447883 RepID=A0A2B7YCB5_POLH7|nr:hypothetical protein AJ80_04482 [Polytolypa hystricis UAMH7299]